MLASNALYLWGTVNNFHFSNHFKSRTQIWGPNPGPEFGPRIGPRIRAPNPGPESGPRIRAPNPGPESGPQIRAPDLGPKPEPDMHRISGCAVSLHLIPSVSANLVLVSSSYHFLPVPDDTCQYLLILTCGISQGLFLPLLCSYQHLPPLLHTYQHLSPIFFIFASGTHQRYLIIGFA